MLQYILELTICWGILLIIYRSLLSKETFFNINRFFLLSSLVAGILIPLLRMSPAFWGDEIYSVSQMIEVFPTASIPEYTATTAENHISWKSLLWLIYTLGATVAAIRLLYGIMKIVNLYRQGEKHLKNGYTLVKTNRAHLPFSFFNFVFLSNKLPLKKDIDKILKHEITHIKHGHSFDVIIIELIGILFWFHPFIYFYKNAIKQCHEYLADAQVLLDSNKKEYGHLLIRRSSTDLELNLANHFFKSHIKNRINMMYRNKSKKPALLKYLMVIPILLVLTVLLSAYKSEMPNTFTTNSINKSTNQTDPIQNVAPQMPRFPGCEDMDGTNVEKENCAKKKMLHYIYANLTYPKEAKEKGIQGQIVLQFVVEKDGSLTNINLVRKIGGGCDEEARQIVAKMNNLAQKWTPGMKDDKPVRVLYTLPIRFKIEENTVVDTIPPPPPPPSMNDSPPSKPSVSDMVPPPPPPPPTLRILLESIKKKNLPADEIPHIYIDDVLQPWPLPESVLDVEFPQVKMEKKEIVKYDIMKFYTTNNPGKKSKKETKNVPRKNKSMTIGKVYKDKSKNTEGDILPPPPPPPPPPPIFKKEEEIFKLVEQMPRFSGCEDMIGTDKEKEKCAKEKMLHYIYTNITYPEEARKKGVEGQVVLQFVIDKDGSIIDINILRDPGAGTGEMAKAIIENMNHLPQKWTPGRQRGRPVRVIYTLPIKFELENDKKEKK